jgi:hypothetical protein
MSRKLRSLAALATVALIGAVCSNSFAEDHAGASPKRVRWRHSAAVPPRGKTSDDASGGVRCFLPVEPDRFRWQTDLPAVFQ